MLEPATIPYDVIPTPPAGSPDWLELRRLGIGGSDVSAIMGVNQYRNDLDVFMDKTGRSTEQPTNMAMFLGTEMEPIILKLYEMETGHTGHKPESMFRSQQYPWLVGNLDWLKQEHDLVVEAKRSDAPKRWGDTGTDEVPVEYFMQVQTYMLITGIDLAEIVALLPYNDLRIFPIPADHEIQQRIVEATGEFWERHIKTDTPPLLKVGHSGSLDTVRSLYPDVAKKCVVLPDPLSATVERHLELKSKIKKMTEEAEGLQAIILDRIGDAETAEIPGRYTFKRTRVAKKPYTVNPKPYVTLSIKEIA